MPLRSLIRVPQDWILEDRRTVGPFVTRERYRLPDGSHRTWTSRRQRKLGREEERTEPLVRPWLRPHLLGWWVAVLFMVGSLAFALGPIPAYADAVASSTVGLTYFVGSLFFTTAAYLQFVQTVNARTEPVPTGDAHRVRLIGWQPHRLDWWAASVQLIGTLLFNRSTLHALDTALGVHAQDRLIWAPDMLGSLAFIVASTLAWIEVSSGWWSWRPEEIPWRITALNQLGSIAFLVSAVAAFVRPANGDLVNIQIANLGTFLGAICFFVGALLLIPELGEA